MELVYRRKYLGEDFPQYILFAAYIRNLFAAVKSLQDLETGTLALHDLLPDIHAR